MADISKIKLPDGTEYNIKDTVARQSSGASDIFWATYGTTTYQEIENALEDDKLVLVKTTNSYNSFNTYVYAFATSSSFCFARMHGSTNSPSYRLVAIDTTDIWTTNIVSMADQVIEQGTIAGGHGTWFYTKWNSGKVEAWYNMNSAVSCSITTSSAGTYKGTMNITIPSDIFDDTPKVGIVNTAQSGTTVHGNIRLVSKTSAEAVFTRDSSGSVNITAHIYLMYYPTS